MWCVCVLQARADVWHLDKIASYSRCNQCYLGKSIDDKNLSVLL